MGACQKPEQAVEDYIWVICVLYDPAISGDDVIPVSGVEQVEYDKYTLGGHTAICVLYIPYIYYVQCI